MDGMPVSWGWTENTSGRYGRLEQAWLSRQVSPLDDVSGDIHTLMDRLAAICI
jgi:hypothetical protein